MSYISVNEYDYHFFRKRLKVQIGTNKNWGAAAPPVNLKSNTMKNTLQRYNYFLNYQRNLAEIFKIMKFSWKCLVNSTECTTFAPRIHTEKFGYPKNGRRETVRVKFIRRETLVSFYKV